MHFCQILSNFHGAASLRRGSEEQPQAAAPSAAGFRRVQCLLVGICGGGVLPAGGVRPHFPPAVRGEVAEGVRLYVPALPGRGGAGGGGGGAPAAAGQGGG